MGHSEGGQWSWCAARAMLEGKVDADRETLAALVGRTYGIGDPLHVVTTGTHITNEFLYEFHLHFP